MPRATQLLLLLLPAAQSHFHQSWEEGSLYGYKWYGQDWVKVVRDFYCDESCQHRLEESPTIDRMVRAVRRGPTFSPPLPLARTCSTLSRRVAARRCRAEVSAALRGVASDCISAAPFKSPAYACAGRRMA